MPAEKPRLTHVVEQLTSKRCGTAAAGHMTVLNRGVVIIKLILPVKSDMHVKFSVLRGCGSHNFDSCRVTCSTLSFSIEQFWPNAPP